MFGDILTVSYFSEFIIPLFRDGLYHCSYMISHLFPTIQFVLISNLGPQNTRNQTCAPFWQPTSAPISLSICYLFLVSDRTTFVWPWKSVRNLFHGPKFGKIKTKLLLIRAKETPNMGSSTTQSHYCYSNDVTAKCRSLSRKFHGEMTLFASAFTKPMKTRARLFLFDKPIKCFAFFHTFCF